jgi:hypothetical protein
MFSVSVNLVSSSSSHMHMWLSSHRGEGGFEFGFGFSGFCFTVASGTRSELRLADGMRPSLRDSK